MNIETKRSVFLTLCIAIGLMIVGSAMYLWATSAINWFGVGFILTCTTFSVGFFVMLGLAGVWSAVDKKLF